MQKDEAAGQGAPGDSAVVDGNGSFLASPDLERALGGDGVDAAGLQAILNAVPQMLWTAQTDGTAEYFNTRWEEFTGRPVEMADSEGRTNLLHPDDRGRGLLVWKERLADGEPYECEMRIMHRSGQYRWTLCRALPLRNEAGEIVRWFGTCTDIDALKQSEQERELIALELSHRIKNIFAVVGSLISLSARSLPESSAFANDLLERIGTLARAHNFLNAQPADAGNTASLHGLLRSLAAPYRNGNGDDGIRERIAIRGEDVQVALHAATTLSLIVHELATNAVKYGALSNEQGQVDLDCRDAGDIFVLRWNESGGPPVEGKPDHAGFGLKMARRAAIVQLQATLEEDWQREGFSLVLSIPRINLER